MKAFCPVHGRYFDLCMKYWENNTRLSFMPEAFGVLRVTQFFVPFRFSFRIREFGYHVPRQFLFPSLPQGQYRLQDPSKLD